MKYKFDALAGAEIVCSLAAIGNYLLPFHSASIMGETISESIARYYYDQHASSVVVVWSLVLGLNLLLKLRWRTAWYSFFPCAFLAAIPAIMGFQGIGEESLGIFGATMKIMPGIAAFLSCFLTLILIICPICEWATSISRKNNSGSNSAVSAGHSSAPIASEERGTQRKWLKPAAIVCGVGAIAVICIVLICGRHSAAEAAENYGLPQYIQVSDGSAWSILNLEGKVVADKEYASDCYLTNIYDGAYWVDEGGGWQLFNISNPGMPVSDHKWEQVTEFGSGTAAAGTGIDAIKLVDTKGDVIATLPDNIDRVNPFSSDGLAAFHDTKTDQWGYIDTKGKVVIPSTLWEGKQFNDGYVVFDKIYDTKGNATALPAGYAGMGDEVAHEGLLTCYINDKASIYDIKSGNVTPVEFATQLMSFRDGYAVFEVDGHFGVINREGKRMIREKYDYIDNGGSGYFIASRGGEIGLVDANDNIQIPFRSGRGLTAMAGGNVISLEDGMYTILSNDGRPLSSPFNRHNGYCYAKFKSGSVSFTNLHPIIDPIVKHISGENQFGLSSSISATQAAKHFEMTFDQDAAESHSIGAKYNGLGVTLTFDRAAALVKSHVETSGSGWLAFDETVIDGYEPNPDAKLTDITVHIRIPDSAPYNADMVKKALTAELGKRGYNDFDISSHGYEEIDEEEDLAIASSGTCLNLNINFER